MAARRYDWFDWKVKWRWIYSALRDRWKLLDVGSLIAAALVFVYALFSRKLTLVAEPCLLGIVLAVSLRSCPDRVRLGLCRHAAGSLPDRGRAPRHRFRELPSRRTGQVLAVLGLLFFATGTAANTASLAMAG